MNVHESRQQRARRGFSLLELLIVMVIAGVIGGLTIPKLALSSYRVDAIAQQVRSVFQTAQRTSLTRQYDVIVSFDTIRSELRIAEDINLSSTIDVGETRFWRPTGVAEGNIFSVPPVGYRNMTVTKSIIGAALKQVDGLPSITFHRDGSTSSEAEVYVSNSSRGQMQYRVVTLTQSTGRSDLYRLTCKTSISCWKISR